LVVESAEAGYDAAQEALPVSRLTVIAPDGYVEYTADLDPTRAILLGRTPSEGGIAEPDNPGHVVPITVVSPSVSANHALVSTHDGEVRVRDLGSRNGTWLLLPKNHSVPVGNADVTLQLGKAKASSSLADDPEPPVWHRRSDYGFAVTRAIEAWLTAHDIQAQVVLQSSPEPNRSPAQIPLANGSAIDIVSRGTADATWPGLLEHMWRWVGHQNSLFESEESTRNEGMILASRAIRRAHRDVVEAAQRDAKTLLLMGPSGAGKEVLAEVFHRASGRSGPLITTNCSTFSKELLRSELFGAEPGSFTSATRRIVGAVERAQGGTLFLDEIGELPIDLQAMLLRFLDRREFEHLGETGRTRTADVRIVAATNRDLRAATRAGDFRVDLWYRLSVYVVDVPSLQSRWEDVLAYLESMQLNAGVSARDALVPDALEVLQKHPWEGNFRELTNFVLRLPRDASRGSIDVPTCLRVLNAGALRTTSALPAITDHDETSGPKWADLAVKAVEAFFEDHGHEPKSWDDQKEWNEKYLKPLLFFHLGNSGTDAEPMSEEAMSSLASQAAARLQADRGTAVKQLARYFERFGR
jgi:DNA-binding NtrC family response regulator